MKMPMGSLFIINKFEIEILMINLIIMMRTLGPKTINMHFQFSIINRDLNLNLKFKWKLILQFCLIGT
ncbi:hypothetical protein DERP_000343 [Dermatophagoides pteronyssinus]|uniref:Uncharacterized protein n=1 Tax=Dermatophagoides pteronyssinus TaxID=6956 RepID=A0ABQ8IZY8_DERPT|nr:hypothetical protein DERP_000343 [Dermatophagoides pteronyssinus]